jgi:DNA-binding MarR family transcriptional regulator
MPVPNLTQSEYAALSEFRYRLRLFLSFSEAQARASGLNPQQHQLLLAIKAFEPQPPSVGMLAERLMLRHHSTVELIDRLQRRGLVARTRSSVDRRSISVGITAKGAHLLRRLSVTHRDELQRTGPDLAKALSSLLKARRQVGTRARGGSAR